MLPLLLCSLLLTPRPSISLSPVWRAEELHIPELLLRALATPSPFPYSLSFLRSLYPDINPSQPSRHTSCPHLSYCKHFLVLQSRTPHLVLLQFTRLRAFVHRNFRSALWHLFHPFQKPFYSIHTVPCAYYLWFPLFHLPANCHHHSQCIWFNMPFNKQARLGTKMLLGHYCQVGPISC